MKHVTVKLVQTFNDECLDVFINKSEMENESSIISTFHLVHVIPFNMVFKLNDIYSVAGKEIPRINLHIPFLLYYSANSCISLKYRSK